MIVIVAVMFVIVAAAGAVFALVASTQSEEPSLRLGPAARMAERLGMRRRDEVGSSSLMSVIATRPRSTARQD